MNENEAPTDITSPPPDEYYGPALPPSKPAPSSEARILGPTLPPAEILAKIQNNAYSSEEDDDEDMIGPVPGSSNYELEKRAIELKLSQLTGESSSSKTETSGREEWMLELPRVQSLTSMGLQARQFRAKERPDFSDRTSWTDTPEEREKKVKGPTDKEIKREKEREKRARHIAKRDAEQEAIVKKHKKKHKRDESLVDIHEKKLKKKKKKEERDRDGKPLRRPFDRDQDLQVNKFDEAQKKAVLKKAQLLDTRFSSGESKFL